MAWKEYSRRNLLVAKADGIKANTRVALVRLSKMKRPPDWLVVALESIRDRIDPIPRELARWRNVAPDAPKPGDGSGMIERRRTDRRGQG